MVVGGAAVGGRSGRVDESSVWCVRRLGEGRQCGGGGGGIKGKGLKEGEGQVCTGGGEGGGIKLGVAVGRGVEGD